MATEKNLNDTRDSLDRIQQFEVSKLERSNELGMALSFVDTLKSAQAVVDLYKRIPMAALSDFTEEQLNAIKGQANADYQMFDTMLKFDPAKEGSPAQKRH